MRTYTRYEMPLGDIRALPRRPFPLRLRRLPGILLLLLGRCIRRGLRVCQGVRGRPGKIPYILPPRAPRRNPINPKHHTLNPRP